MTKQTDTRPTHDDYADAVQLAGEWKRKARAYEKALAAINAALTQNKTFPADVEYARNVARNALKLV